MEGDNPSLFDGNIQEFACRHWKYHKKPQSGSRLPGRDSNQTPIEYRSSIPSRFRERNLWPCCSYSADLGFESRSGYRTYRLKFFDNELVFPYPSQFTVNNYPMTRYCVTDSVKEVSSGIKNRDLITLYA